MRATRGSPRCSSRSDATSAGHPHACLWAITAVPRLGSHSRALIDNQAGAVRLSHVSLWEIAIKHCLAQVMPLSAAQGITWAEQSGFELLPIDLPHLLTLEALPLHHRDPFDRLLVAQALREGLTLLTADAAFGAYGCLLQDARR